MRTLNIVLAVLVLATCFDATAQAADTTSTDQQWLTVTWIKTSPEPEIPSIDETLRSKKFHGMPSYEELTECNIFHSDGSCSWSASALVKSKDELLREFEKDAMSLHDHKQPETVTIASR